MTTAMHNPTPQEADLDQRIRLCIKALVRNREGMTLELLAERMGSIHVNTLSAHLNGKSGGLSLHELLSICDVLGLSLTELIDLAESEKGGGLLLWADLQLVSSNEHPTRTSPRRPLLVLVDPE